MKTVPEIALAAMLGMIAGVVQAAEGSLGASSAATNPAPAWMHSERNAFGSTLKDYGLTVQLTYRGEVFHSFNLIPDNDTRYRGLVDLHLALDTGRSGLWPNGELFIYGQNGHGNGFNVNPSGDPLPISNIDARDFTQISQFGLKQELLGGKAQIRLGKQDVNAIFDVNHFGAEFIFPAYTLIPTIPMPTFPAPALGTSVFVEPADRLSMGMGIYDGDPQVENLGFDSTFDGKGGYFSVFEAAWKPCFGTAKQLAGDYHLGLWHHSGDFAATGDGSGSRVYSDNFGLYLMFEQRVYKERPVEKDDQGLDVFFQFGWAPSDRNPVWRYVGTGFSYQGLLAGRADDSLNIGLNHSWLAGSEPAERSTSHMSNVELFYLLRLTSALSLQPDVQYFRNPDDNHRSGYGAGFRCILRF